MSVAACTIAFLCDASGNFVASHGSTYSSDPLISTIKLSLDTWTHIGVTYNNTSKKMYSKILYDDDDNVYLE
jgi:hypothetical protein